MSSAHCVCGLATAVLLLSMAAPASAEQCLIEGRGAACRQSSDCAVHAPATLCIDGTCQLPCEDDAGAPEPSACAIGEACVPGQAPRRDAFYCKPTPFGVDLNVLDACVKVLTAKGVSEELIFYDKFG